MKRKEPAPLKDLVTPLFRERKQEGHLTLTAARARWAEIVGPELARRSWPIRLQRGVLWVGAQDASWAYQFQFLRTELMQGLTAALGPTDIRELRFKEAERPAEADAAVAESAPAPLPAAPSDEPQPPADAQDPVTAELTRAAASIPDPALRALFVRSLAKQRKRRDRAGEAP